MSKGSRDRTTDHGEYGRSIERVRRNEARKRKLADKNKKGKREER
jgi:hypothetical protein